MKTIKMKSNYAINLKEKDVYNCYLGIASKEIFKELESIIKLSQDNGKLNEVTASVTLDDIKKLFGVK